MVAQQMIKPSHRRTVYKLAKKFIKLVFIKNKSELPGFKSMPD